MKYFRSIYHCVMMILMFIQCSGVVLSANIYEPTETSENKFNILSSNTNEHIKKESNLDFDLNKKIIFRGSLQLIIKEIEPKKLGKYEAWDIKKIHKDKE